MTPRYWYYMASKFNAQMFLVGSTITNGNTNVSYGLRPVINLRSDVTFSSGNGTLTNPYVVAS